MSNQSTPRKLPKCKAWDATNKAWLTTGFRLYFGADGTYEGLDPFEQPHVSREIVPVFWTGRTDKHGEDIYDGWVIKSERPWIAWGEALFVVRYEDGEWNYSYDLHEYAVNPERDWEVVGNVWEHPELAPEGDQQ